MHSWKVRGSWMAWWRSVGAVDEDIEVCILKGSMALGSSQGGVGLGCGVGQDWKDVKWLVMI